MTLSVKRPEDASELMGHADWLARLAIWENCLTQATALVMESTTALAPARFLEVDVWLRLPSQDRRRFGSILDEEWLMDRRMDDKIDAALAAIASTRKALTVCIITLDRCGCPSWDFVNALGLLVPGFQELHTALKCFDFAPLGN